MTEIESLSARLMLAREHRTCKMCKFHTDTNALLCKLLPDRRECISNAFIYWQGNTYAFVELAKQKLSA